MNFALKKEISNLGLMAAAGVLLKGNRRLASYLGLAALGVRAIPAPQFSYENQTVVITGGSRGLGLALAEELVSRGAKVALLARDPQELQRAKSQLELLPNAQVLTIVCDVTHRQQLKEAFEKVRSTFGSLCILVNNAGSVVAAPFEAMNQKDFEAQMNLHFYAVLKAVQLALPIFKSQGFGRIVNISSIGGRIPVPHMIPYVASKFAVSGFSQALSTELRKESIQVTTIYPGLMRTGSPVQGVFKGDSEKEFAWFAVSDNTPLLTVSAKNAARQILCAVQNGESDLVISLPAKLGAFAYSNFPQIVTAILGIVNRLLPAGTSQERKTGAQSQGWLENQVWSKPFVGIMKTAQKKYNEHEKTDADFNLNAKEIGI